LRELNYADGILKGIVSERTTGIVGDKADLNRRKAVYGENIKPLPPASSIKESFKQEVKNIMWVIIGATAILAGICGIYADGWGAPLEAISIILIGLIIILITSVTDYFKDKKFIELSALLKEEQTTVIRGKFGAAERVSVWSLVVGDIIMVKEGQRIPADCLVIEAADLEVDEDPEEKLIKKVVKEGDPKPEFIKLSRTPKAPFELGENISSDYG